MWEGELCLIAIHMHCLVGRFSCQICYGVPSLPGRTSNVPFGFQLYPGRNGALEKGAHLTGRQYGRKCNNTPGNGLLVRRVSGKWLKGLSDGTRCCSLVFLTTETMIADGR